MQMHHKKIVILVYMLRSQRHNLLIAILLILGVFPVAGNAQQFFEGQVINKISELPVSGVTVRLLKENFTASTNDRGYYKLNSENPVTGDTLVFSSVGYITFLLPVASYQKNALILLEASNESLNEVVVTDRKLKVLKLNNFSFANLKDQRDDPTNAKSQHGSKPTQPFSTPYTFAKLFTAPDDNTILTTIELGRREFDESRYPQRPLIMSNPNTRFRMHILSEAANTRKPGKVMFSTTVDLTDNALWVSIDLSKENLVIPWKRFFVAIEWLRIPYNELVKLEYAPKIRKVKKNGKSLLEDVSRYSILYQPALVAYRRKKPQESWIKTGTGDWRPYNSSEINT